MNKNNNNNNNSVQMKVILLQYFKTIYPLNNYPFGNLKAILGKERPFKKQYVIFRQKQTHNNSK